MKILITGATGYLGSHLVKHLLDDPEHQVVSLSRSAHSAFGGASNFSEIQLDPLNLDTCRAPVLEFKPDAIVHPAALSSAYRCECDPVQARQANVELTRFMCELAQEGGAYLTHISTDWVFDGQLAPEGGFTEDHIPDPVSVYSQTKYAAEQEVPEEFSILRTSILYGPEIGEKKSSLSWMEDGLKGLLSLKLFEDEWRTPIFVRDGILAIEQLITTKAPGLFHCAGPERISRANFGELYAKCFGYSPALIQRVKRADVESIPNRPEDLSLDASKLASQLDLRFLAPEEAFEYLRNI